MLDRHHQVAALLALEGQGLDDLGPSILELAGLRGHNVIVIGVTRLTLSLGLESARLFLCRAAFRAALCQHLLDTLHLVDIRQCGTERDTLDRVERTDRALINTIHEGPNGTALLSAGMIIGVLVVTLIGVESVLDSFEQDINESVLQAIELMGSEADKM